MFAILASVNAVFLTCSFINPSIAIPALKPVVQDLFISKNQIRADSAKELDTQREVAFRMLLRLIQYPEVSTLYLQTMQLT